MTKTLSLPARDEAVEFDSAVLSNLCTMHGAATEAFLTGRLTALNALLDAAQADLDAGRVAALLGACDALSAIAREIGMRTMIGACDAVRAAAAQGDRIALAACAARMLRLGRPDTVRRWTVRHATVA